MKHLQRRVLHFFEPFAGERGLHLMRMIRRTERQVLPISAADAWRFFSQPKNLQKITPTSMGFTPLTGDSEPVYSGQILTYKISPLFGWPMRWTTEIVHVEEGVYFVDNQLSGPYALWHHLHRFEAKGPNAVEITDVLHYAVPGGIFGHFLIGWWVKRQVDAIFAFRAERLRTLFPKAD